MLPWLVPLFFFAVLMGSPVPGFLVFTGLGVVHAWQSLHRPQTENAFQWTREDSWLALSFMSIPLFKALSALWSVEPRLALMNAVAHLYFIFWPLVLVGVHKCKGTSQNEVNHAIALGLITVTLWRVAFQITQLSWLDHGSPNRGILAQLALVAGSWNLLALTRPVGPSHPWRLIYLIAAICTFALIVLTERRLELIGFVLLATGILVWRWRSKLTALRLVGLLVAACALLGVLIYLRWEIFSKGVGELSLYFNSNIGQASFVNNSWGSRLEMWRLGLAAFLDHPWLGIGASAQPSSMQTWGGPPAESFGHRHFHGQWLQILVEGGLLGVVVTVLSVSWIVGKLILQPLKSQENIALMGATLIGAYMIEGIASAALHYDKPNAFMVVASAWLWHYARCQTKAANL